VAAFPAEESQLAGLRKTVEEICSQVNLSAREKNNIILAIEEGATNIIRHAYMFSEGEIRLKVAVFKNSVVFSLFDNGKSFQPPDKTRLDLKKMATTGRKGGLGFYLINKVMDRVEYFSFEGENELRMIKFLSDRAEKELEWSGGVSLRVKFSAWTFLIILIIVAGAYLYIDSVSSRYIHSRLEKTVDALANTIASQASDNIINRVSDVQFDELVVSYKRANDVISSIVIIDQDREILADSRNDPRLHTIYDATRLENIRHVGSPTGEPPSDGHFFITRRIGPPGGEFGTVIMEYSSRVMERELKRTRQVILLITGIGLLIGIAGIYLLSNYFVRPIGRIVDRVRRFSHGDLDSQLPLTGAGEFYEISRALNELITRIRRDRKNIVEREILHKEMQMAEEIQRALIPSKLPTTRGFDIAAIYKAAHMVGGDLFDFVQMDEQTLAVAVADVSGKGIPGSLVMAMVRTALQLEARENRSAREILIRLNEFTARHIKQGMFVTILLAVVNTLTGRIDFASAGHNPVIHYDHRRGKARFLNAPGMPVGIKAGNDDFAGAMKSSEIELRENDFLLIYTDGVTEGRGAHKRAYGTERIVELLGENRDGSADDVAQAIESDIARFIGREVQHDDITMVILKYNPSTGDKNGVEEASAEVKSSSQSAAPIDSVTIRTDRQSES